MLIESIAGRLEDLATQVREIDPLELAAEVRARPHFRMRTPAGRELAVSLERGTELQEGDVLVVHAAPEDLIEVAPRSAREWGVAAWQLGNLHREVRFGERTMLTPYEPSTAEVLAQSGIPHARVERPFVGDRYGAYMGDHHEHGALSRPNHGHHHPHGQPHAYRQLAERA